MKNLVWIAMVMGLIGLSFEAVCQEEPAPYGGPQPEPFGQTGGVVGGGFEGFAPGPAGTGMPGMPMMVLPSFEMQKKTALIVPVKPMEADVMGQITEDMHVMTQILREKIHPDQAQTNKYLRLGQEFVGGFFGDTEKMGVAGLYLQGYGMVFLQQVDFPLMPVGEQPPAAASSAQPTDEVWQRTQRKLQGEYEQEEETESQKYDAGRVEHLKESVLQSLRHASNIRHLDKEEWVVVVIKSSPHRTGYVEIAGPYGRGAGIGGVRIESLKTNQEQPSFLVIRAQKKDIDDLAAGRIGPEEFAVKATVITY